MKYLTSKQLSEKWGIGQCRIIRLAREGRIEGARLYGKTWIFPENAEKPSDGRSRRSKIRHDCFEDTGFRYEVFGLDDISGLVPHATEEEKKLNASVQALYKCDFDSARRLLDTLPETAVNIYCRTGALYVGCMSDIISCNVKSFFERYSRLYTELQKEFPHRTETSFIMEQLNATLGFHDYFKNGFRVVPGYSFHKSFLPHLSVLCAVSLSFSDNKNITDTVMSLFETDCLFMEESGYLFDMQALHYYLGTIYLAVRKNKEADYHFRKVFDIAERYGLYYCPASEYYYMQDIFRDILSDYPEVFRERLHCLGIEMHERYVQFINAASMHSIYGLLAGRDYPYIFYAAHGCTNKEIANIMGKTPSAVGMRFASIYTRLGISSKRELIDMYNMYADSSLYSRPADNG